MSKIPNYIAIALTTSCNLECWYCKATGESICPNMMETLKFDDLKKVVKIAYSLGISTFRITGGEPTLVNYLPDFIHYVMNLGDNTKIRLNTNGHKLDDEKLLNVIEFYRDRMDIVISVDSVNEYIQGIHYPKYLSPKIRILAKQLIKKEIPTRFNIVVTKYNISDVNTLINESLTLGVNIKILDLIIRDEYYGIEKSIVGEDAVEFGKCSYAPLAPIIEHLEKISDKSKDEFHTWNGNGIKMGGFFFGKQFVQIKDSLKGAKYSKVCIQECPHFEECHEGLFSPFISVGNILHISGCKYKKLYFNLNNKSEAEIKADFEQILTLFENTELRKH